MCPGLLAPKPKEVDKSTPPAPTETEDVAKLADSASESERLKKKSKGTNSLIIPLGSSAGGNGLSVPK